MRTSSWYVQQLYSIYKGSNVLSITQDNNNVTGRNGLFASAVSDGDLFYIKKINATEEIRNIDINFKGLKKGQILSGLERVRFTADDPNAENTIDEPLRITPVKEPLAMEGGTLPISV